MGQYFYIAPFFVLFKEKYYSLVFERQMFDA